MTRKWILIVAALAVAAAVAAALVLREPQPPEAPVERVEDPEDEEVEITELIIEPDPDEDWAALLEPQEGDGPEISPDGFYQDMEDAFRSIARPGEVERDEVAVRATLTPLPEPVPDEEEDEDDEADDEDGGAR